ncbi:hypothetical protein N8D56_18845 [Devosia sp. A8/3-2]|nr:hypothetical protein N8D56_18845 [Devosia sp. A8/3-2]
MSARELAGDFDLEFDRLSGGHVEELSKLATLTGCDLGELILSTPSSAQKGTLRIGTELIATKFSRRRHLSVCLECWAEDI